MEGTKLGHEIREGDMVHVWIGKRGKQEVWARVLAVQENEEEAGSLVVTVDADGEPMTLELYVDELVTVA